MTGPQAVYWGSFVGMEKGFFAAEGITLDPVYMDTSVRNATALVGGSLDVAGTSPDTIILATEKGADLVVIGEGSPSRSTASWRIPRSSTCRR